MKARALVVRAIDADAALAERHEAFGGGGLLSGRNFIGESVFHL
jgi:hypothetical protein